MEGGKGVFAFVDGSKYTGEWIMKDEKRIRHGRGTLEDGPETFEGQWADDRMNGEGTQSAIRSIPLLRDPLLLLGRYNFASGAVYDVSWALCCICGTDLLMRYPHAGLLQGKQV
jgi:hypothetical protein